MVRGLLICHETLTKGQNTLLTGATTITSKHVLHGLKQKRDRLVSSFLQKKAPDFISQHAMLLDNYFIERYEQSMPIRLTQVMVAFDSVLRIADRVEALTCRDF